MTAAAGRDSALPRWKKLSTLLLRITDFRERERFSRCSCKRGNEGVDWEGGGATILKSLLGRFYPAVDHKKKKGFEAVALLKVVNFRASTS